MKILNETERELLRKVHDLMGGVTNGESPNRDLFPEEKKGNLAKKLWNDDSFSYGMEYGVLLAGLIMLEWLTESQWTAKLT